jgi:predicted RNA-binding protein with PUA-like domain
MRHERRYWLFKSEPSAFSFEDLKNSPGSTACWDGVRNFQARNYLRDVIKPGDGVLFSDNLFRIFRDRGQQLLDKTALYQKLSLRSRCTSENPVWYMVDIRCVCPSSLRRGTESTSRFRNGSSAAEQALHWLHPEESGKCC